MAQYMGTIDGGRGQVSRLGHKNTGLRTVAASWAGAVAVELRHDPETGMDSFVVSLIPWHGRGASKELASGYFEQQ